MNRTKLFILALAGMFAVSCATDNVDQAGPVSTEVAMMKKACVMIPSPNVVDNHQYKNAKVLADANAALMLEEINLNKTTFANAINELVANPKKREELAKNIVQFANLNANELIFNEIIKLTEK